MEPYKLCKCLQEKYGELKNDPLPWYFSFCENEMPFSKMSNNDLKNFLHVENPIFYKNSSIKTMPDEIFLPNESSF